MAVSQAENGRPRFGGTALAIISTDENGWHARTLAALDIAPSVLDANAPILGAVGRVRDSVTHHDLIHDPVTIQEECVASAGDGA